MDFRPANITVGMWEELNTQIRSLALVVKDSNPEIKKAVEVEKEEEYSNVKSLNQLRKEMIGRVDEILLGIKILADRVTAVETTTNEKLEAIEKMVNEKLALLEERVKPIEESDTVNFIIPEAKSRKKK